MFNEYCPERPSNIADRRWNHKMLSVSITLKQPAGTLLKVYMKLSQLGFDIGVSDCLCDASAFLMQRLELYLLTYTLRDRLPSVMFRTAVIPRRAFV